MSMTYEMLRTMKVFLLSTAAALSGYDIMKLSGLSKQCAYQCAHRLTTRGYLASRTERSNPTFGMPPRILYQATPSGVQTARMQLSLLAVST